MNKIFLTLFILTSASQAVSLNEESLSSPHITISNYENEKVSQFVSLIEINNNAKLILRCSHITISTLLIIKKGGILALDPVSRFETSITVSDNGRIIDENLDMILTSSSSEDDWKRWLEFYKLTL